MRARAAIGVATLALASAGWETAVRDPEPEHIYINAYEGVPESGIAGIWRGGTGYDFDRFTNNEHRELAAIALLRLGWGSLLSETPPTMIDLNASLWRDQAREVLRAAADDELGTALIERAWPGISRLAGLPDYAYAVHDWINASTLCPALPPGAEEREESCYVYAAWHGAALNSSHFGEQATAMFRHYHGIALALADNARRLGVAATTAQDRDEMLVYVRAAERQALAFEAVAQHYLQDRWSMGHAWNRWNGPRHADQAGSLFESVSTGLISGFLHGAEAALKKLPVAGTYIAADPMCSPRFVDGGIEVLEVEHGPGTMPMIGDDRLRDALDGGFGREYGVGPDAPDYPLDVTRQMDDLMRCSMAGWGDVARGFHLEGGRSAGLGLAITPATPTFGDDPTFAAASGGGMSAPCWDMWATNDAVKIGIETLGQGKLVELMVKPGVFGMRLLSPRVHFGPVRIDWRAMWLVTNRIRRVARRDPGGTDLARGLSMPDLHGARPGQHYLDSVPMDYSEPLALPGGPEPGPFAGLPLHAEHDDPAAGDRPGRDLHALHGFFHQSQLRYWCEHAEETLSYNRGLDGGFDDPHQGLRWPVPLPGGSAGPSAEQAAVLARRLDACVMLADRTFEGTGASYPGGPPYFGDQRELRRTGHGDDSAGLANSPCALTGDDHDWSDGATVPHPGYVSLAGGPYISDDHYGARVYRSTRAWCQALPVIHVDDEDYAVDPAGARIVVTPGYTPADEISFAPDVLDPLVTIHGLNFGNERGRLKLESEHDCVDPIMVSPYPEIISWTDTAITFRLDETRFPPDTWTIEVIRDDKDADLRAVRSVGRFRLDVRKAIYTDLRDAGGPLPPNVGGQSFRPTHPFCTGGDVLSHQIVDCTGLSGPEMQACGATGGPGNVIWTGPAPMSGYVPGPYAEHRYSVLEVGECPTLDLPGQPCLTPGVRLWYGALYRIERTSTNPIGSPPPKTWRFTLGWRRFGFGQ